MKKLLSALLGIFGLFIVPAYAALPSGYTELEYIESTGTQYIDTGVVPNQDYRFQVRAQFSSVTSGTIIGARTSASTHMFAIASTGTPPDRVYFNGGYGTWGGTTTNPTDTDIHTLDLNKNVFSIDGTVNKTFTAATVTPNTNAYLFVMNTGGSAGSGTYFNGRLYSAQIWNGSGTMVRDFVPARRNSDGVLGMYDTVSGQFFTNSGSGSFLPGEELDSCRNLFDKTNYTEINAFVNANTGVLTSGSSGSATQYSAVIPCKPNTTYTISGRGISSWGAFTSSDVGTTATSFSKVENGSITTGANDRYLIGLIRANSNTIDYRNDLQIEEGSTATPYVPYDPQCATCNGTIVNYTSATGTGVQNGTPTPDNPIYPTFYKQGDMVLRKVGDIADSYDATTGKITRRVGEYIFTGRESIDLQYNVYGIATIPYDMNKVTNASLCSHNKTYTNSMVTNDRTFDKFFFFTNVNRVGFGVNDTPPEITNTETFKQWLAAQYAAGTPVKIYYPLDTEVVEDWTGTRWCDKIEIATTKYNESAFSPLNTALQNAISVVDTVVSNTITQAGRIATLQAQKQTRPNDIADDSEKCPAGKKCLLVEDASGTPHWYEIVENAWVLPAGYTQLEYIESTGTQYIDTGVKTGSATSYGYDLTYQYTELLSGVENGVTIVGIRQTNSEGGWGNLYWANYTGYTRGRSIFGGLPNSVIQYFEDATNTTTVYTTSFDANKTTRAWSIKDSVSGSFSGILDRPFDCIDLNVYLFRFNSGTQTPSQLPKVRVYSFIMRIDGNVVRNFVPAKNPDGKIGMYDLANGVFYENQGTGEFIPGDPVSE